MKQYNQALQDILDKGTVKHNRTGIDTKAIFGYQMRFNLQDGFPAVTTKKLAWKAVVSELLWFLEGSGDERRLAEILHGTRDDDKKTIWTANAEADYWIGNAKYKGDLGRVYGIQWRHWLTGKKKWLSSSESVDEEVDQIADLIDSLKNDPESRRHLLTAWHPGELSQMALPPCHLLAQFDVTDGKLSCMMTQRSADFPLGIPFNIASYALLTHILAHLCNLTVGELIIVTGDSHIYVNQIDGVKEQLTRIPKALPTLTINKLNGCKTLDDVLQLSVNDFKLENYTPEESIKFPFAT